MPIAGSGSVPSPMCDLLVRAAVLPAQESLAAWNEWERTYRFQDALNAKTVRLLPAIGHAFYERGIEAAHFRILHALCLQAEVRNKYLLQQGIALASALEKQGMPCMFLKGAALLVHGIYALDERTLSDLDLLVRPAQRDAAMRFLQQSGWSPELGLHGESETCSHGMHMRRDDLTIDLHWYVMKEWCSETADEGIWQRSRILPWAEGHVRVQEVTDILLHVLVNGARAFSEECQWALDASRLLNQHSMSIDWPVFLREVRTRRLDPTVQLLFSYLTDICKVAIRPEVDEQLRAAPKNLILRLEHVPKAHRLHSISLLLAIFLRHRAGVIGIGTPLQFLYFLREAWGLSSWKAFPGECISRIVRQLRRKA